MPRWGTDGQVSLGLQEDRRRTPSLFCAHRLFYPCVVCGGRVLTPRLPTLD
jgi:hypothetical protein